MHFSLSSFPRLCHVACWGCVAFIPELVLLLKNKSKFQVFASGFPCVWFHLTKL